MTIKTKFSSILSLVSQPLLLNLISIPATGYIIRELGPIHYGEWTLINVIINIIGSFNSIGFRNFFIKKIAQEPNLIENHVSDQICLRLIITTIVTFLVLSVELYRNRITYLFFCEVILAVSVIISSIASVLSDTLQGIEKFQDFAKASLISGLSLTILSVFAIRLHTGIIGLSLAYLSGPLINLLYLYIIYKNHFNIHYSFNQKRLMYLVTESKEVNIQKIVAILQDRIEQLITPLLISIDKFGIFSAATLPSNRLSIISESIVSVFYPTLSHTFKNDQISFRKNFIDMFTVICITCVPACLYLWHFADTISHLLFRKEYDTCKLVIQWTIFSVPIQGIWNAMGYSLLVAEKHIITSKIGIWISLISVITSSLLIYQYGILGICYAWVIRSIIPILLMGKLFNETFPYIFRPLRITQLLICYTALIISLTLPTKLFIKTSALTEIMSVILSLILYIYSLIHLKFINIDKILSKKTEGFGQK